MSEAKGNIVPLNNKKPSTISFTTSESWQPDTGSGLILEVDMEPIDAYLKAPAIGIFFPAFTDGRGLSLAVLLRDRFGYQGEIRALGDINIDLLHYLKRCGFDCAEIPENLVNEEGLDAKSNFNLLKPYTENYQASIVEPNPAFRRLDMDS